MIDAYCHLDMSVAQPIADLERCMDTAGIDRALIVETWSGDNYGSLLELIASPSNRFCLAFCFRPGDGQTGVEFLPLETLGALRVRTADLHHLGPIAAKLESTGKWLLPHAELGIGALAASLLQLTQLHPNLRTYLPHMGWPRRDKKDDDDWFESISKLRNLPNLTVGVSAIAHFSRDAFPHEDVAPFAAHLLDIFGQDSLAAASDYPLFQEGRYAQYIKLASDWIGVGSPGHRFETDLFARQLSEPKG